MTRHGLVALLVLSLAAGGCAAGRPSHWWPLPWPAPAPAEVPRSEPRPEPDRLEPLYRAAKVHIAERRDDQAYRALLQIARINPRYRDGPILLRDVRTRLVRGHYQEGLRLFREERLEDAIAEWRVVLDLEPAHANARRNIEQAEQILRTLAEHRKR